MLADRPNRTDRGRVGGHAGDGGLDARARVRLRAPRPAPRAPAQGGLRALSFSVACLKPCHAMPCHITVLLLVARAPPRALAPMSTTRVRGEITPRRSRSRECVQYSYSAFSEVRGVCGVRAGLRAGDRAHAHALAERLAAGARGARDRPRARRARPRLPLRAGTPHATHTMPCIPLLVVLLLLVQSIVLWCLSLLVSLCFIARSSAI